MKKLSVTDCLNLLFPFEGDESEIDDGPSVELDSDIGSESDSDSLEADPTFVLKPQKRKLAGKEEMDDEDGRIAVSPELDAADQDGFCHLPDDKADSKTTGKKTRAWLRGVQETVNLPFLGAPQVYPDELKSPYEYFKDFITDSMLKHVAEQSKLYYSQCQREKEASEAAQKFDQLNSSWNSENSKRGRPSKRCRDDASNISGCSSIHGTASPIKRPKVYKSRTFSTEDSVASVAAEIEVVIGILLRMGISQFPHVFDYWNGHLRLSQIADCMPRERFGFLMRHLHFRDNDSVIESEKRGDRMWKMRVWFNMLLERFGTVPPLQCLSVDEQMIPFKGRNIMKQYMPNKPTKRGFKVWALADISGYVHKFEVYTGQRSDEAKAEDKLSGLGMGGSVLLHMIRDIPPYQNFKIFSDRFFNSLKLFEKLKSSGYEATGTVLIHRIDKPPLKSEKQLKVLGRGSSDEVFEAHSGVRAVCWFDNKIVTLCSTYIGIEPQDVCMRWDSKAQKHIEIPRPAIIKEYNAFMGGVDLSDMLRSMYRFSLRCRRFYMYHFLYSLNLAVRNAWILYRRHAAHLEMPALALKHFILEIFGVISHKSKHTARPLFFAAPVECRFDNIGHFPVAIPSDRRCRNCNKKSRIICVKCNVGLCVKLGETCYVDYHTAGRFKVKNKKGGFKS